MKISLFFLILISFNALAVQHFTCFPPDVYSTDRVVIALKSDSEGTLFLTSGLDDWGNQDHSGVLLLTKKTFTNTDLVWEAQNETSVFTVFIPRNVIGKNADGVKVKLNLKNNDYNVDQEVTCYTRVY